MPEALWRGMHERLSCCLKGLGASLVDVGVTRSRWLPLIPGTGMSEHPEVYRPLAGGEIVCSSPSAASTVRAGGRVNERKKTGAGSCLHQTTAHFVHPGIGRRRLMAQVRVLAKWL